MDQTEGWLHFQQSEMGDFVGKFCVMNPFLGLRYYSNRPESPRGVPVGRKIPQKLVVVPEGFVFGGDVELTEVENENLSLELDEIDDTILYPFLIRLRSPLTKNKITLRLATEEIKDRDLWVDALNKAVVVQKYLNACRQCGIGPSESLFRYLLSSTYSEVLIVQRSLTFPMLGSIVMFCRMMEHK